MTRKRHFRLGAERLKKFHSNNTSKEPWNKGNPAYSGERQPFTRPSLQQLPEGFNYLGTHRLRPAPTTSDDDSDYTEHIIGDINRVERLVNTGKDHWGQTKCMADLVYDIVQRKGLCVIARLRCPKCGFIGEPIPQSEEVKTGSRGPKAGVLNDRLALAVVKTKAGPGDVKFILSCLDIRVPSCIFEKVNKLADKVISKNKESMLANQHLCVATNGSQDVDVETDTSYNNRPQAGFEAGTQAFAPAIDQKTGLVLSLSVANKLCPIKGCNHENCRKNFTDEESIASAEKTLAKANLNKIDEAKVATVASVTSDASAMLAKVVTDHGKEKRRGIGHFLCLIHRMRTLQKALKKITLTSQRAPGVDKDVLMKKLSTSIRKRVYWEVVRGFRRGKSIQKVEEAVENILNCFAGDHTKCRKVSLVCRELVEALNQRRPPRYLPYGRYIELNENDIQNIRRVLGNYATNGQLDKVKRLYNTNRSESMHHRVFTYAPKCTTYARNFEALCHSAVLSSTYGTGRSTLMLAHKGAAARGPMSEYMRKVDERMKKDRKRKASKEYKTHRHIARKRKCNRGLQQVSAFRQLGRTSDHGYGINPYN